MKLTDTQKKVLLDIFGSPWVILPIFAGLTGLILGWATAPGWLSAMCSLFGVGGLLSGLGIFGTRLVLSGSNLVEKQKQYEHEEKLEKLKQHLEFLDRKLVTDRDSRTQNCLREIWQLYQNLQEDVREGKIAKYNYRVLDTIEKLFCACVSQLEQTYDLYESSRPLKGDAKIEATKKREKLIEEVLTAADKLGHAVKQFHVNRGNKNRDEVNKLTKQLDLQMEAARAVDTSLRDVSAEFEEYMREK